ncbi:uncharacterized protein LOC134203016 [Armigeres subalbatus]|uniref:uncharacterized protein LOC134203016 n=1 Tax=Armigeres subalbatus TaxID=124917 RepID=UPI002ED03514
MVNHSKEFQSSSLFISFRPHSTKKQRELWEATIEHGELPTYDDTIEFLRKRCLILERCESIIPAMPASKQVPAKPASSGKGSKISVAVTTSNEIICELCNGDHPNFKCNAFKNMTIAQRLAKARDAKVCFNCLRKGHMIRTCPSQRLCAKCNKKHHSMLHQDQPEDAVQLVPKENPTVCLEVVGNVEADQQENGSVSVTTSCLGGEIIRAPKQVLLQTAVIDVFDARGRPHPCRALLDSGSQAHILSQAMARKLGMPILKCNITVIGANAMKTHVNKRMNLNFSSRYCDFQDSIACLISDRPTGNVPSAEINVSSWNIPSGIKLADPDFFQPHEIDLVLASDFVWNMLRSGKVVLSNGTASLRETDLGWIITGTYDLYQQVSGTMLFSNVAVQDQLAEQIERFWLVEDVAESSYNTEEQAVEEHFLQTYRRDESGRFVVQMPFREEVEELEDNRSLALKRFFALERKLSRNTELRDEYLAFMREYELLGHCKEIKEEDDVFGVPRYYLPHHAVFKLASSSTKLRVVFDASAKASKYSLNDVMKTGPTVQNDIFSVNLRFRQHVFGFSGDVTKMYRQILIDSFHTRFLRIFWREDTSKPLRVLELLTVTYGTAAAPFLATRCLVQLATEEEHRFPIASKMVLKDVYVDDMLSGADTEEEAKQRLLK